MKELLNSFKKHLYCQERSLNTIYKYLRDIRNFCDFLQGKELNCETVIAYKNHLISMDFAPRSVNSMLAAINSFLSFINRADCKVKAIKLQKPVCSGAEAELTRDEYLRLVKTANSKNNERLSLLLQTVCGTGIRVSELQFITVENVKRGQAIVSLKGKVRTVFIIKKLQKLLLRYAKAHKITGGPIFITGTGKPMDRSNIWKEMKALCKHAGVSEKKVFPHNLRHLFARTFYSIDKDIAKLADILGHSSINTTRIYIMSTGTEHQKLLHQMHLIL